MPLCYLELSSTDPARNLAVEQYIFDSLPRDRSFFMLWQNDRAVIVGKYQNAYAEVNAAFAKEHGIRVVRRLSGGGAVYHDLGNLNYTIITDAGDPSALDFGIFCEPVRRTLRALGIEAEVSGRNDMTVRGRKFSGSAQYVKQGRVMHHGTILYNSDLSMMSGVLHVDESKFQSKASKSVRSRVTNIAGELSCPVTLSEFRARLLREVLRDSGGSSLTLSEDELSDIERIRAERYADWGWNYGLSPVSAFVRRARLEQCGLVEAHAGITDGLISEMHFLGDFFCVREPEELAAHFLGCTPDEDGFARALEGVDASDFIVGLRSSELLRLLCS